MKKQNQLFNWIGGKTWLSEPLNTTFLKFKKEAPVIYAEPFAGGLGSFLSTLETLKKIGVKKVYLNDINKTLISTYDFIKNNHKELTEMYLLLEKNYLQCIPLESYDLHKTKDKVKLKILLSEARDFYNLKRAEFNLIKETGSLQSCALFLFLMQHNFNGVYRENSKGELNIPYNWEIKKINESTKINLIQYYSELFNSFDISFSNKDCFSFINEMKNKKEKTLIYFDPPYFNESISENKYNKDHFCIEKQILLLEQLKHFDCFVFSNHYSKTFHTFSKDNNYRIKYFYRSNIISQDKNTRGIKVKEILIFPK